MRASIRIMLVMGMLALLVSGVPAAEPAQAHDVNCAPKILHSPKNTGPGLRGRFYVNCPYPAMTWDVHPTLGRGHVDKHQVFVDLEMKARYPWQKNESVAANNTRLTRHRVSDGYVYLQRCKKGRWYRTVGTHVAMGWKGFMPYTLVSGWVVCDG